MDHISGSINTIGSIELPSERAPPDAQQMTSCELIMGLYNLKKFGEVVEIFLAESFSPRSIYPVSETKVRKSLLGFCTF